MIPVFNREDYIGLAIASVLSQTYRNFELIVHDDASTDHSLAVIRQFHDSRLRVIHTSKNHGMLGGWNYLLKKARGEYLKQMGSDDLLHPDCIAKEVKALQDNPGVALVTCQRQVIGESGEPTKTFQFSDHTQVVSGTAHAHWILTTLRENKIGEPCATMFRRSVIARAGMFDPQFSQFADFEYWIRILQFGDLLYLHEPLCSFRMHPGSNTTSAIRDGRFISEIYTLIAKYYKDLPAVSTTQSLQAGPFFVKNFSLTPTDYRHVLRQKTLDTLKNIKDLVLCGELSQSARYLSRLVSVLIIESWQRKV